MNLLTSFKQFIIKSTIILIILQVSVYSFCSLILSRNFSLDSTDLSLVNVEAAPLSDTEILNRCVSLGYKNTIKDFLDRYEYLENLYQVLKNTENIKEKVLYQDEINKIEKFDTEMIAKLNGNKEKKTLIRKAVNALY